MRYCIDASALIDLGERHYPERLSIFAPIWTNIYDGIDAGEIVSVDYVKTELEREAAEWRIQFLAKTSRMFLISEEIEQEFATLIREIELDPRFNANKQRERFFSGADPWLIALARNLGNCTVISAEKKSLGHYGLGAVCKALNVPHLNLVEFFEAKGIR